MDDLSLSGLILAGGQSTRMGQDKALLPIDGEPMLKRVCVAALACADPVYILTPWPERYREIAPAACQWLAEAPPADPTQATAGPLLALAQGLAQVHTEWVLVLACDLPCITGAIVQQWRHQLTQATQEIAVLPLGEKGWEPLCGFYRRASLEPLQTAISQGTRSFQHWLANESVKPLQVDDPTVLLNCNTPADVARINLARVNLARANWANAD
jgi:molybdenum cofactor guanylyltransferase